MPKLALLGVLVAVVSTPHVVARVPTGDSPSGAIAAYGAVWVANDRSGTLARIDPKTNRVVGTVKSGPGPFVVTFGYGDAWVPSYKGIDVWRIRP